VSDQRPERVDLYAANLREYMDGAGEAALKSAYEMAREAMAEGVGVLEMAAIHHEAMARVIPDARGAVARSQRILAAETFFVESLSPFEMTHRAFRESNAALRLLNERLEKEASRIAHALHAEASQLLVSSYLVLESVSSELPPDVRHHLSKLRILLDQISEQIRRLSHELRPTILEDLGLLPALRGLAEGVSARSSVPVTVEGALGTRPAPEVETAIYRAVQEALSNMTKHAGATAAVVHVLQEHHRIVCSVRDNGAGFDETAVAGVKRTGGIGLMGIRERLQPLRGTLRIISAAGRGTDLIITVPTEG
jgi:two-component system, NarL family, sensor histidine kinase UhpB